MDTFVSLPVYEGLKSYQTLKYDDFKENYLLYISCFQLKKHLKLIESRIIKNFEKKIYLEESFQILDEICGFEKRNIFKLGTLFDMFSKIDYSKYKKEIFNIFYLQIHLAQFNKKWKYAKAYKLYKAFKVDFLQFSKEDFFNFRIEEKSLLYIFYQVLVYYYTKNITERFFRIDRLISVLDKDTLLALRTDFADSCKEFDKLTKKYEEVS